MYNLYSSLTAALYRFYMCMVLVLKVLYAYIQCTVNFMLQANMSNEDARANGPNGRHEASEPPQMRSRQHAGRVAQPLAVLPPAGWRQLQGYWERRRARAPSRRRNRRTRDCRGRSIAADVDVGGDAREVGAIVGRSAASARVPAAVFARGSASGTCAPRPPAPSRPGRCRSCHCMYSNTMGKLRIHAIN